MSSPEVTVLLPVYNGARFLRESIGSILRQRFCDFEVLVIDDGSSDDTPAVLASFGDSRIRVLRNERNLGLVPSLNRGLAEARGEWIARQDADDISAPGRLAAQMSFVRGNPAVPLIGSDAWLIGEQGGPAGRWRTGGHADLVAWDLCFRTPFAHGSALFRRKLIVEKFGGYRDLRACEDLDLWSRVAREFPVVTLRQPLVKYRLHGSSIMAGANENTTRSEAVREVLADHLRAVAPGLAGNDRACLAEVWSGGAPNDWDLYFAALEFLELNFSRGRCRPPGFDRLLAEQNYTLFYRQKRTGGAVPFLCALKKADRRRFLQLPWLRVAVSLLRK